MSKTDQRVPFASLDDWARAASAQLARNDGIVRLLRGSPSPTREAKDTGQAERIDHFFATMPQPT